tara:strand:+ start:403 stop:744 length:342 start_codon:yes stop_codon:yes gene_type:complete
MNTIRGKIINPDTNRYVLKTSKKGQEVQKNYQELLAKWRKKKLTKKEKKYLDTILYSKFCKCTKAILLKEYKKECPNKPLAYGACTKSLYKKRRIKVPPLASRKCKTTFKWYR